MVFVCVCRDSVGLMSWYIKERTGKPVPKQKIGRTVVVNNELNDGPAGG